MRPERFVIGITGGIATGKSAVLNLLHRRVIPVLSSDTLAHQCLNKSHPCYQKVVHHFGRDILDTKLQINRKRLGQIVFASAVQRKWLEKQIHPWVIRQLKSFIRKHRGLTALDIPLLFEVRLENLVDVTVVVACTRARQIQRIMRRDGLSRTSALQRIRSQMPLSTKMQRADYVIENNATMKDLKRRVNELLYTWRRRMS